MPLSAAICRVESVSVRYRLDLFPFANVRVASSNLVSCSTQTLSASATFGGGAFVMGIA